MTINKAYWIKACTEHITVTCQVNKFLEYLVAKRSLGALGWMTSRNHEVLCPCHIKYTLFEQVTTKQ